MPGEFARNYFLAGCGKRVGFQICKEHAQICREANSGGCGEPTTPRQRRPDVYSRSPRLNLPGACSLMERMPFCARGIVGVLSLSCFRRIGFELSREPLRVMRVSSCSTAGTAVCACLFLSCERDGNGRMTGSGLLTVRVSERLWAVRLPFSVLREA